jgi:hypothetical protein
VLVVALAVSCASPRVKRRDPEAVLAPNPTLLGPRPTAEVAPAETEPAKVTLAAPAPLPSRPGEPPPVVPAKDRLQQIPWNKSLFLPDLLTPGAPNLVLLGEASCLSCKVIEVALPAAVDRSPHLRIISLELSPTEPTAKALRAAFEADELPVAVVFGPTGEPRRVIHDAAEIQNLLANEAWEAPVPVVRPQAPAAPVAQPVASAPPAEPEAEPAKGPGTRREQKKREREQQNRDKPGQPPPGDLKEKPADPVIHVPDEGPYVTPAPEAKARSAPSDQAEAAPRK